MNIEGTQFLVTSVTPESYLIFQEKRKSYGTKWLWHGSHAERWYRILHSGLKDMANSNYQLHAGQIFGYGIYMSDSFLYSRDYCTPAKNIYKNSKLPKKFVVISLVENAAVPGLSKTVQAHEFTQKDNSACITRVLFMMKADIRNFEDYNVLKKPPCVPDCYKVITHQMKAYI